MHLGLGCVEHWLQPSSVSVFAENLPQTSTWLEKSANQFIIPTDVFSKMGKQESAASKFDESYLQDFSGFIFGTIFFLSKMIPRLIITSQRQHYHELLHYILAISLKFSIFACNFLAHQHTNQQPQPQSFSPQTIYQSLALTTESESHQSHTESHAAESARIKNPSCHCRQGCDIPNIINKNRLLFFIIEKHIHT